MAKSEIRSAERTGLPGRWLHLMRSAWNRLPEWATNRPTHSNRPAPVVWVIVLGVILLALASPLIAAQSRLAMLLIGAILGFAGFWALVQWPVLGFLALIPVSLVVTFSVGTGSQTGIHGGVLIVVLLSGLWVLDLISREKRIYLMRNRVVIAALVFCVISLVAFGFGQIKWFPLPAAPLRAQLGGLGIFILSAITLLLAAHRIQSIRHLEWFVWVYFAFGGFYVLVRTVPFLIPYYERIFVADAVQGAVFYVWLAALGVSQVLLNPKLSLRGRALIIMLLVGLLYLNLGLTRDWVSGWLPPTIAVFVVVLFARPKLGIALIFFGLLALPFVFSSITGVFTSGDNTYSSLTRLEAWKIIWKLIQINPVFGLGMSNYYWYTPQYSILGYQIKFNSHNNYIDLVAQAGFVGLMCFLWLFAELWRFGWNLRTRAPVGFEKAYAIGALGGLVGTLAAGLLGDWIIPFVYNIGLGGFRASLFGFFFLGGLLAIDRLIEGKTAG